MQIKVGRMDAKLTELSKKLDEASGEAIESAWSVSVPLSSWRFGGT